MPWWIRTIVYKFTFPHLKINPSVEIENSGCFHYGIRCMISKHTNIVIHDKGFLSLNDDVYIGRNVEIGSDDITIGFDTSLQDRCILLGTIKIGAGCILAPNIFISSGGHHFEINPYLPIREQDVIGVKSVPHKPVIIEDDCWIGINSIIMPGVVIGKGSVIGAGSIVTKNIPPYSVSVGAPTKVIRKRLEFSPLKELLPENESSLPYFYSGFRYAYENNQRKIFVRESIFSFALNFDGSETVEIVFNNHSDLEVAISADTTSFILPKGESRIDIAINTEMYIHRKLILTITNTVLLSNTLEILKIKTN